MASKFFGYLLVLVGLAIILTTLYGSYEIFTGKISVPSVFPAPQKEEITPGDKTQDIQKQMEETIKKQISDLIPADYISKLLNLIAWSILAGILIFGGTQIAGIGVKLVAIKKDPQV